MGLKTYEDIVHEALADCAEAGYPQHSISESICGLAKERDEAVKELETIKKSEQELRMQYISDFGQEQQCYEENAKLKAELEEIKKQEPECWIDEAGEMCLYYDKENAPSDSIPLYSKPVHQHSFTVDGHTFYADSELDILYLERKFGVGGKAKLEVVKDEEEKIHTAGFLLKPSGTAKEVFMAKPSGAKQKAIKMAEELNAKLNFVIKGRHL